MFRIHYNPKLGRFLIQVNKFHIFWSTVMTLKDDSSKTELLTFKTFDEAVEYVKNVGLDKLYRDRSENRFREYMDQKQIETRVISYNGFGRSDNEHIRR